LLERQVKAGDFNYLDKLFVGYTLLDPADGWAAVRKVANERSNDFLVRYSALRAVRFFQADRPDVVTRKDRLAVLAPFLDQDDIADLAVMELYRWRCWDLTERVLALFDEQIKDKSTTNVTRRAIIRYALQCPDERCKKFISEQRKTNREWVEDQEELLKLEDDPAQQIKQ
jgi:hypothetical protein